MSNVESTIRADILQLHEHAVEQSMTAQEYRAQVRGILQRRFTSTNVLPTSLVDALLGMFEGQLGLTDLLQLGMKGKL